MAESAAEVPQPTREEVAKSRAVNQKVLSVEQSEGMGARVRRSIGRRELRSFDPFLMLDEFLVGQPAGFPDHPHRGFETVTYLLPQSKGSFEHEDFCGHRGKLEPGDLQWMTAGQGIVHAEVPCSEEKAHGLQLWVNLKKDLKMTEPNYQELSAADIPHVTEGGVTAIVIAGKSFGIESPVRTLTPTYYLHFLMEPHSKLEQKIPVSYNTFLYTLSGKALFGNGEQAVAADAHHTLTLTRGDDQDGIIVTTGDDSCEFVLIGGEPTGDKVVQHGPFVMTTPDEIEQAFVDYQMGRNGFEKRIGWSSEISRAILKY